MIHEIKHHIFPNPIEKGYSFIVNKDELLRIYDELVKIRELRCKEKGGIIEEDDELGNAIYKLDKWYAYLLEDCGLVEIEEN